MQASNGITSSYFGSPKLPKLLNEYSIVVQEFFQKRVTTWFETVGKTVFGINHFWIRYEFAPGVLPYTASKDKAQDQLTKKIPNQYQCLICDPHDSSAENTHLSVFYTAISRATTLGDEDGLILLFIWKGKKQQKTV